MGCDEDEAETSAEAKRGQESCNVRAFRTTRSDPTAGARLQIHLNFIYGTHSYAARSCIYSSLIRIFILGIYLWNWGAHVARARHRARSDNG